MKKRVRLAVVRNNARDRGDGGDKYDRWQALSDLASWLEDELSEHPAKRQTATDGAALLLAFEWALELFPAPEAPFTDFEAYAVRHFLTACRFGLATPGLLYRKKAAAVEAVARAVADEDI